jgi:hypothetical protein
VFSGYDFCHKCNAENHWYFGYEEYIPEVIKIKCWNCGYKYQYNAKEMLDRANEKTKE